MTSINNDTMTTQKVPMTGGVDDYISNEKGVLNE